MGRPDLGRQGPRPIVAFDFDGTLTWKDSFIAFLKWRAGPWRWAAGLARLLPELLVYLVLKDRGRLKAAAARVFLRGMTTEALDRACAAFADSPEGLGLIRPDAEQCWKDWKAKGAMMVIVTASPEAEVAPFARRLGADLLLGTRLLVGPDGRIDGALDGQNCRGREKVARLLAVFGPDLSLTAAYGDTAGDRELLERAEIRGYRVFHARP